MRVLSSTSTKMVLRQIHIVVGYKNIFNCIMG
nr:MAG TPA: hypothetical protein [Caudoviricetes sp.]